MYILQGTRGLQCRSADSVLVLVICTIEDMFYLHNLCTLCTSRWSVNVCRYTYCTSYRLPFGKKSETYIISSHLCALPCTYCPIQYYLYIIWYRSKLRVNFFPYPNLSTYSIEDLFLGCCCCCYSPKKLQRRNLSLSVEVYTSTFHDGKKF